MGCEMGPQEALLSSGHQRSRPISRHGCKHSGERKS